MNSKILSIFGAIFFWGLNIYAQTPKIISGKWKAQTFPLSCWAATLSNVSRPKVFKPKFILSESTYHNAHPTEAENLDTIGKYANKNYDFQIFKDDEVLNWTTLKKVISMRNARPLIYSFKVESDFAYHSINFFGHEDIRNADPRMNKWIYVFDPKPDKKGAYYVKNYLTYCLVHPNVASSERNKQGTFFNFVRKGPSNRKYKIIPDLAEKAILNENFKNCVSESELRNLIEQLLDNSSHKFNTTIGMIREKRYLIDKPISITVFQDDVVVEAERVASDTAQYQRVVQNSSKSYIIPYVRIVDEKLRFTTGVIIRNTKQRDEEQCLVLDAIQNINFLDEISLSYWKKSDIQPDALHLSSELSFILDKDNNIFVKSIDNNKTRFYDVNQTLSKEVKVYENETDFNSAYFKYRFLVKERPVKILDMELKQSWEEQRVFNSQQPEILRFNEVKYKEYLKNNVKKVLIMTPLGQ